MKIPKTLETKTARPVAAWLVAAAACAALAACGGSGSGSGGSDGTPTSGTAGGGGSATPPSGSSSSASGSSSGASGASGSSSGASGPSSGASSPQRTAADFAITAADWLEPTLVAVDAGASTPLTSGRAVTLRVQLTSNVAGLVPQVQLRLYDANGQRLNAGADLMTAPPSVPASAPAPADAGYTYAVDPDWIRPGLRAELQVDPDGTYQVTNPATAQKQWTPAVNRAQVMRLSAVPVVIAGAQALVPDTTQIHDALVAVYPLTDVQVTVHAPYTSTTVTVPITASNEGSLDAWGDLLGEINGLWRVEDIAGQHYFGFIPKVDGYGTVGDGFVPGTVAVGRAPQSASETGWRGTMEHETGHNFDRPHSPCGTAGDPTYPYAGGGLGTAWGYDRRSATFIDPATTKDLMGYCSPSWVSDWTYDHVQSYLGAHPLDDLPGGTVAAAAADRKTAQAVASPAQALLLVQGTIGQGQATLRPVLPFEGRPDADAGRYLLRLRDVSGRAEQLHFDARLTDHDGGVAHFAVGVPALDHLASIELYDGARLLQRSVLPTASATAAKHQAQVAAAGAQTESAAIDHGQLTVKWDATAYPRAAVSYLGATGRNVLALSATGGSFSVPVSSLPWQGGQVELGLYDEAGNHRLVKLGVGAGR